jgi:hypothetical protein
MTRLIARGMIQVMDMVSRMAIRDARTNPAALDRLLTEKLGLEKTYNDCGTESEGSESE